uniref:Endonuclease exonuclease phosphatase domain containing protein n=1 Tax=Haemonchus contortus TaxID=6289 RepID=A0A7I4Z481_HAECO
MLLLDESLKCNVLRWAGECFKQVRGLAMGQSSAHPLKAKTAIVKNVSKTASAIPSESALRIESMEMAQQIAQGNGYGCDGQPLWRRRHARMEHEQEEEGRKAYAPTADSDEEQHDHFYEQLEELVRRQRGNVVVMGDFNARVGSQKHGVAFGHIRQKSARSLGRD